MSKVYNDGIPESVFLAVQNDQYNPGDSDYTPSSLNSPAYQRRLERDHADQICEAASSRIWALLGTSVHHMIELASEKGKHLESERRFYGEIDIDGEWFKIGSQIDIIDHAANAIQDFKCTGTFGFGKIKPEWESQLNVGRWCVFMETGKLIDTLTIVAIWRDWMKSKAVNNEYGYPQKMITEIDIPVWPFEKTVAWIQEKIIERETALKAESINEVPPCSQEDMWAKADRFAVKKPGGTRALKVFDSQSEAIEFSKTKAGSVIETRHGARTRCEGYCPVSKFCPSFQNSWRK